VALGQSLQQKLLQKLSPQQIQLMKLLQVPTANLEERIKEELEANPALELEEGEHKEEEEYADDFENSTEDTDNFDEQDGSLEDYDSVDVTEYLHDDDGEIAEYKTREDNYSDDEKTQQIPIKTEASFYDVLEGQLGLLSLEEKQQNIAEHIIGSIDEDGYLRRDTPALVDDLAFRQNIETTISEVESIIKMIQQFDPAGVGARDLPECLLLQLQRQQQEGKEVSLAIVAIQKYFDEFTKKHYEKIQKGLNLSEDELKEVMQQIIRLSPKPGSHAGSEYSAEQYVIPDFFILNHNGKLELTLNSRNAPELHISEGYKDMMKEYSRGNKKNKQQKEAVLFIKQKIEAAKWFIDAIQQRQHTLLDTMTAILQHQENFFMTGDETQLRPMILKDIAEKTNLDISTVSRVANSKFVQTEFGTYRLKFFFSESLSTESGEEVSTREVKKILSDIIESEGKRHPFSDEKLTDMLQEKGYNIARRTVAKYREQVNIPVARLRKELV